MQPANQWSWQESLANKAANLLDLLVWQNSNMGVRKSKQTPKPEPFTPDFMKPPKKASRINDGVEAHTTEELRKILPSLRG